MKTAMDKTAASYPRVGGLTYYEADGLNIYAEMPDSPEEPAWFRAQYAALVAACAWIVTGWLW